MNKKTIVNCIRENESGKWVLLQFRYSWRYGFLCSCFIVVGVVHAFTHAHTGQQIQSSSVHITTRCLLCISFFSLSMKHKTNKNWNRMIKWSIEVHIVLKYTSHVYCKQLQETHRIEEDSNDTKKSRILFKLYTQSKVNSYMRLICDRLVWICVYSGLN